MGLFGGNSSKIINVKLRKISEITATLPFTEFDFMQKNNDKITFPLSKLLIEVYLLRIGEGASAYSFPFLFGYSIVFL